MDTTTLARFRAYLSANFSNVKDVTLALDDDSEVSGLVTRFDPDLQFVVVESGYLLRQEPHPTLIAAERILQATVTPHNGAQLTY